MNEDKIIQMLLNHEERLDRIEQNMATKKDMHEISNTLDKLVGLAEKKDQELTIMSHDVRAIEDDIEKIKPLVGLA